MEPAHKDTKGATYIQLCFSFVGMLSSFRGAKCVVIGNQCLN